MITFAMKDTLWKTHQVVVGDLLYTIQSFLHTIMSSMLRIPFSQDKLIALDLKNLVKKQGNYLVRRLVSFIHSTSLEIGNYFENS